jgi:hypothetical protein
MKEQDCLKCEWKNEPYHTDKRDFCYMFHKKVKHCGKFKPILTQQQKENKQNIQKCFPKWGIYLDK